MKRTILLSLMLILMMPCTYAQHWSLTYKKLNLSSPNLAEIGRIAVSTSAELNSNRWSVGCETLDRDYGKFAEYKDYVGKLGIGYARIQSGWAKCEQVKGTYDFAWLDEIVDGLLAQGVRPWMSLSYGNPIYQADKGLGSKIFTDKPTMEAWCRYVNAVVERYKGKIAMWEVWNEPNLGKNAKYPEAYATLLINTAKIIRGVDPNAKIIGFALSRMPLDYTAKVMDILKSENELGLLNYVSFHPYYENPDSAAEAIKALKQLVTSYSPSIKLFQGECGCPSILEWGHALRYIEWSEYSQAKWDLRRMVCDFSMDIQSSIFTIVDLQYPNMQQSFGLMRTNLLNKTVYRRPAYYAVQHLVNILTNEYHSSQLLCKFKSSRKIQVCGIANSKGKNVGAIIWYGDKTPSSDISWDRVNASIYGLDIQNPVYIEPITGKIFDVKYKKSSDKIVFPKLPVWDSPMIIIDKSEVKFAQKTEMETSKFRGSTDDMLY